MSKLTYKDSGVNIEAGYEAVSKIKKHVKSTFNSSVIDNFGSFGGLFKADFSKYKNPILVSGTDGVGTKLLLAIELDKHDTIGIDLVAMCVNDIIALGATPLFFLDYMGLHQLDPSQFEKIIVGIVSGCKQSGCALIGGETAEMRDVYKKGDYDLAGFVVGVVDESKMINGSTISEGDVLLSLPSSGVHSNGYSLARKIVDRVKDPKEQLAMKEDLLTPTIIYVDTVLDLVDKFTIKGISNITGGGLYENVARILPDSLNAVITRSKLTPPEIFGKLQKVGAIEDIEMFKTFNMGVGMALVATRNEAAKITAYSPDIIEIGIITKGEGDVVIEGLG